MLSRCARLRRLSSLTAFSKRSVMNCCRFPIYNHNLVHHKTLLQPQRRNASDSAGSPKKPLKTYGILHPNIRQLFKIIHPDTFRRYIKDESAESEKYRKLSAINQRSLQNLNSFNSTMKNYTKNMGTFLKGNGESVFVEFHILQPLEDKTVDIKTIRTSFEYPHVNKQLWVKHANPEMQMHHWRDVRMLDLLNRAHILVGEALEITLLPSSQELEVLQTISKQTRIPLPVQFQEPNVNFTPGNEGVDDKNLEYLNIPFEDQKKYDAKKKLKEHGLLWEEPDNTQDFYSLLRLQNLKESRHPRSPEYHMNKKFGIVFHEPAKDQLMKQLACMQIDFPAGTEPELIRKSHQFLIENAKELKIWEWYHTPIIFGTSRCKLIDKCVLGIPFTPSVDEVNVYLESNLPVIQQNGELFRQRLAHVGEKMIQLQEHLSLVDVKSDLFVTYDQVEACLDHLLDKKEFLDTFNLTTLKINIYNKRGFSFFSDTTGTLYIPYDITGEELSTFLENCKSVNLFANYRIARKSIGHLKRLLLEKAKVLSIDVSEAIKRNTLAYQSLLSRICVYISEFAPYNTLKGMHIVARIDGLMKYDADGGTLHLPASFKPKELDEYFVKIIEQRKLEFDHKRVASGSPNLRLSHLKGNSPDDHLLSKELPPSLLEHNIKH